MGVGAATRETRTGNGIDRERTSTRTHGERGVRELGGKGSERHGREAAGETGSDGRVGTPSARRRYVPSMSASSSRGTCVNEP